MKVQRILIFVLASTLFSGVALAQCVGSETAIFADRDNTLYESATGALSNGAGSFIFAGTTLAGEPRRALLHFDVAGTVPAMSTILSARLELTMTRSLAGTVDVSVHPALADWGEGTSVAPMGQGGGAAATTNDATWLHTFFNTSFWAVAGGDFGPASATTPVGTNGTYGWSGTTVTADVQGWLDTPATNYGWVVVADEVTVPSAKRFGGRISGSPPVLCVATQAPSVTQIPTLGEWGLVLMALALAGVALRRLR